MNDLFELSKDENKMIYIRLKRPLKYDDFMIVRDQENSVSFISDSKWDFTILDDKVLASLKIKLNCAEELKSKLAILEESAEFRNNDLKSIASTRSVSYHKFIKLQGCRTEASKNRKRKATINLAKKELAQIQERKLKGLIDFQIEQICKCIKSARIDYIIKTADDLERNQEFHTQKHLTSSIEKKEAEEEALSQNLKELKDKISKERDIIYTEKKEILIKLIEKEDKTIVESAKAEIIEKIKENKRKKSPFGI